MIPIFRSSYLGNESQMARTWLDVTPPDIFLGPECGVRGGSTTHALAMRMPEAPSVRTSHF